MISFSWIFVAGKWVSNSNKWPSDIKSAVEDIRKDVLKDLEDANVSIKIESNGENIEINTGSNKDSLVKQLENLESGKKDKNDTLKKVK
jgi:hypothetical protein